MSLFSQFTFEQNWLNSLPTDTIPNETKNAILGQMYSLSWVKQQPDATISADSLQNDEKDEVDEDEEDKVASPENLKKPQKPNKPKKRKQKTRPDYQLCFGCDLKDATMRCNRPSVLAMNDKQITQAQVFLVLKNDLDSPDSKLFCKIHQRRITKGENITLFGKAALNMEDVEPEQQAPDSKKSKKSDVADVPENDLPSEDELKSVIADVVMGKNCGNIIEDYPADGYNCHYFNSDTGIGVVDNNDNTCIVFRKVKDSYSMFDFSELDIKKDPFIGTFITMMKQHLP